MTLSLSEKQLEFKQKIIDDPQVVEALIGGSAGGSKTMSMCIAMMLSIAMYPGIQFALGRKTLQGLIRSTVATLLGKAHPMFSIGSNDFHYDKKDGIITYKNGSKITLLALDYEPSDPDFARLGSAEFDWAFIDEAGEIGRQAKDVLRSRLGRGIATQQYEMPPKIILSCIPTGGLVQTNSGYKKVENVSASDMLLCDDGSFSPILQFFRREINEPIYRIKCASNALPLELTGNHPVLVSTPKNWIENSNIDNNRQQTYNIYIDHNFQFRPASEIVEGDWLRMPITREVLDCPYRWEGPEKARKSSPFNVQDFWWLVGYWLNRGQVKNNRIILTCDSEQTTIIERICSVINRLKHKPRIVKNNNNSTTISFNFGRLGDFLCSQFLGEDGEKQIPYWAQNYQYNLSLVDGFFDTDGIVSQENGTMVFTSTNYPLLCSIQQILFKYGIVSSSEYSPVIKKAQYYLSVSRTDANLFATHTTSTRITTSYKQKKYAYLPTNCYIEGGYVMFKVESVSARHYTGTVYNFETQPHNYIAGNFTCHNCNPSTNFLRTEYYQPYKNLGAGGFQKWQIGEVIVRGQTKPAYRAFLRMSVQDNPFIDKNYYQTLKQLPERERKRLLDGNWDYSDNDKMLFTGELIEDCTVYALPEMSVVEKYDYLMGVDVGDVGFDSSVISIVQNNILIRQIRINLREAGIGKGSKIDVGDFLSEKIIYHAKRLGFTEKDARRITVETNGIGASLRDALRRKKWFVTEYTASSKSRANMFYSLHELMVDGKVSIYAKGELDYDELRRQLTAHEYEMEGDRVKLTSKRDLKRQLGCSPDMADSFAIAMFPRGDAFEMVTPPKINYFTKIKI